MAFKQYGVLALMLLNIALSAQEQEIKNYDHTYVNYIRSVQFHAAGLVHANPIVELGGSAQLTLTFDDLEADIKDYFYTIVHCDRDWQPSDVPEMEYLEGFNEERIQNYQFSMKTFWPYTHYRLDLPNRDMRWRLSGNYLLLVYDESDNRKLVITRRFVVVEKQVSISPRFIRANNVSKLRTHQEIHFNVNHRQLKIQNPMREITATVLQNGRWDNAVTEVPPKFIRPELMIFEYQDKVAFPGGKEFRFVDLRSFRRVAFNVASARQDEEGYVVEMKADVPRNHLAYTTFEDLNGRFFIQTSDQNHGASRTEIYESDQIYAEYADVSFALSVTEIPDHDIYLFGAFTNWRPQEEYKMYYDPKLEAYTTWTILKQGYYDYMYAAVPKGSKDQEVDLSLLEGHSNEAINDYTIIIYYRPFGTRYDQAIGSLTFTSTLGGR